MSKKLSEFPIRLEYSTSDYHAQPHTIEVGYRVFSDLLWVLEDAPLGEMKQWLQEQTQETNSIFGQWSEIRCMFSFRDKSLAMAFKLRFS